jgi:hypothetical protein
MQSWLLGFVDICRKFVEQKSLSIKNKSEVLEKLLVEFQLLDIEKLLGRPVNKKDENIEDVESSDDGASVHDILIFLTKVCYQKKIGTIGDDEFQFFRGYIERVLKNRTVRIWISKYHQERNIGIEQSPYCHLLRYGVQIGNVDIIKPDKIRKELLPISVSASDNKKYKTHLKILNGIFNKGLLQHARATSPLDESNIVWFPSITEKGKPSPSRWRNEISEDGSEIREYWPDENGRQKVLSGFKNRYVFAKYNTKKDGVHYVFKGVYKRAKEDKGTGCMVYTRIADSFSVNGKFEEN